MFESLVLGEALILFFSEHLRAMLVSLGISRFWHCIATGVEHHLCVSLGHAVSILSRAACSAFREGM